MSRHLGFVLAAAIIASTSVAIAADVKSPRDVATGQASGKRVHYDVAKAKVFETEAEARASCDSSKESVSSVDGKFVCTALRESPTLQSTGATTIKK